MPPQPLTNKASRSKAAKQNLLSARFNRPRALNVECRLVCLPEAFSVFTIELSLKLFYLHLNTHYIKEYQRSVYFLWLSSEGFLTYNHSLPTSMGAKQRLQSKLGAVKGSWQRHSAKCAGRKLKVATALPCPAPIQLQNHASALKSHRLRNRNSAPMFSVPRREPGRSPNQDGAA